MVIRILTVFSFFILCVGYSQQPQQGYYDPANPQSPNYNPNGNPQISKPDTTDDSADTTQKVKEKFDFWNSPKVATFASMALPGLGQAYNKKYWKVPIVWGLMGTLGYFFIRSAAEYSQYREAYFLLRNYTNGDPPRVIELDSLSNITYRQNRYDVLREETSIFNTKNQLPQYNFTTLADSAQIDREVAYYRDNARRTRDFMGLFLLIAYVLNMADAAVDAHFAKFDVSDNLSLKISPKINSYANQPFLGLSLQLLEIDNRRKQHYFIEKDL